MTKRNLPTAPMSEDEALQELKNSPMWPPEPPATCYVVLEFACVVDGAADLDAAYDNAEAQLRAHLTEQACLRMKLIAQKDYQSFMREWNPDDDDEDEADLHPLFGCSFTWVMRPNNLPESPAALLVAVEAENKTMLNDDPDGTPYEVTRLAELSGMSALDVRFTHWFQGKENVKRIGDGSHDLSYAEIIWLLHQSVIKDKLGDHVFFEGLIPVASDGSAPLFNAVMGS